MPSSANLGEHEKRLAALDAAIERGLADANAGRVTPIEIVGARLAAKYEAMSKVNAGHPNK